MWAVFKAGQFSALAGATHAHLIHGWAGQEEPTAFAHTSGSSSSTWPVPLHAASHHPLVSPELPYSTARPPKAGPRAGTASLPAHFMGQSTSQPAQHPVEGEINPLLMEGAEDWWCPSWRPVHHDARVKRWTNKRVLSFQLPLCLKKWGDWTPHSCFLVACHSFKQSRNW